jgi:TonB-linked SusC/RagA family outer membrane protein
MEKRLTMLLACLFLSLGMAMAQMKVNGTVLSQEDGQPVIGATVQVVGTNVGAVTDVNGRFSLTCPEGKNTLRITYVGMEPLEVSARPNVRIMLTNDQKALDEVVVVGYGSGRKVGTVVGSVTTVHSEKLNVAPSASALDALQGQVAGLNVLTSSGESGDNAVSMSIHGIGSLGASSTPLYVIDGIPSSSRTIMAMNPNDIESVTVLKDASATSIYGSRAANGVIYVTTKSGKYSSEAKVTYRTQYGRNTLANKGFYENMMSASELTQFWLDAFGEWGVTEDYLKQRFYDKGYNADTKWYEVLQNWDAVQTQNDISIEGGSDKVKYMLGASQFHQDGTTIGNYYDRYTARANVDARPKEWLKFGANVNFSYDKRQRNGNWGNSSSGNSNYLAGGLSMLQNPLYPQYDENGDEYNRYPGNNLWNPVYYMETHPDQYLRYGLIGNAYIEISPIKNLKIMSRLGTDMYFVRNNWKTLPSFPGANGSGTKGKSMDFDYSNTITNTIEYKFNIGSDHYFTVLGGMEGVENDYDYFYASSRGQDDDRLMNLQNGLQSTYAMSESATSSKFLSFFGRIDYALMDKYFFDASIRNDACSRFGANNRNATFWSAGAMWKIGKEEFMKDVKWVNDLNFKVSYGTQGNASIGDYSAIGSIGTMAKYNDAATWAYSSPGNPNLTWETQKLLTIGLNGRLFNFMDFDLSYYVRKTSDMLMDVPYPYTTGFEEITDNVGTLQNSGIDVELNFNILKGKDYYLNFRTIFNYNSQKITELFQGRDRWQIANTGVAYVVGSPVMFYYPVYAGVDPEDGEMMWYVPGENIDENHQVETTKDFDEASLEQNTGKKRYAPVNGGFSITAGWKGFSIAADFTYVLGKYLINNDAYFYANPGQFLWYNTSKDVSDYWTPENRNAKYPNWTNDAVMQFDTHLLQNASFMRLKNLQIGYNFPKSLLGFQNVVKGLKITLTGRNLFTITDYEGIDPEVNSNLTLGKIGNSKQYLIGAEITF